MQLITFIGIIMHMSLPKIIDNNRTKLLDTIIRLSPQYKDLSIATGYWDLESMRLLLTQLRNLSKIRLLIGREPLIPRYQLEKPELDYPDQDFKYDLSNIKQDSDLKDLITEIKEWITDGKLEVKVYRKNFLHAKCFIFGTYDSPEAVGIIGSSNMTKNGLTHNSELNALESDQRVVVFQPRNNEQEIGHLYWFDQLWNDETTENWNEQFGSILEASPVGDKLFSPYETYIKTLYELYSDEIKDGEQIISNGQGKNLFDFQAKNVQALLRRLRKYNVSLLSDSVGLGKTTTAISVIKQYVDNKEGKKRVEIICPKSLVQQWEKELTSEGLYGYKPITLQNPREIEEKTNLDNIASVSLFVIDESHNLRHTNGSRFKQLLDWIRNNPKAHVLLLTATPINNELSDITNQILLGTAGNPEVFKVTIADDQKQTVQISFYQAIENLKKKINQDLKRTGKIDYEYIKQVMTPIVRAFVVRRTRQGIEQEYGSLIINGEEKKFPKTRPEVLEYSFDQALTLQILGLNTEKVDLNKLYSLNPEEIIEVCKDLKHPLDQVDNLTPTRDFTKLKDESPMYFVFQMILMLGFIPYRWMMYKTEYYGKTREQIKELKLNSEENKKLLLQLGIFGILRTVFLKRMESSVSALLNSLVTYRDKLDLFVMGLDQGRIVSLNDLEALQVSLNDEDIEIDPTLLQETELDTVDEKKYQLKQMREDIKKERQLIDVITKQLEILIKDDSKLKNLAGLLRYFDNRNQKVLIFSYFADTIDYLEHELPKYADFINTQNSAFISSKTKNNAENIAGRFSPRSKMYKLKDGETEIQYLFSTDVLSEGQNLQDAGILINYDLHWNPVRMIQRNGRINRLGSSFDEVSIFNMRPEAKLDSYLKLIQRLQGKIDLIRNTIGTDTPVLDEAANPIEYSDSIIDIYSEDLQKRMKALEDAEKASDFLLSEDEFVVDLKKFNSSDKFTRKYKEAIYGISKGKWAITPKNPTRLGERPEVFALTKLFVKNEPVGLQFVITDKNGSKIQAVSQLQALEWLRTDANSNDRSKDNITANRIIIEEQVKNVIQYYGEEETGSLIGQENDILRLLFENGYPEEDIECVRDAFKTKDIFYTRDIKKLKRTIMAEKNKGGYYQDDLREITSLAKKISEDTGQGEQITIPDSAEAILFYAKDNE